MCASSYMTHHGWIKYNIETESYVYLSFSASSHTNTDVHYTLMNHGHCVVLLGKKVLIPMIRQWISICSLILQTILNFQFSLHIKHASLTEKRLCQLLIIHFLFHF